MYITCRKCTTSFVVKPNQIGPEGRVVRCSKCYNMWHAEPKLELAAEVKITPAKELLKLPSSGIHLPAVLDKESQKTSFDRVIILMMFIVFSAIIFFSKEIDFGLKATKNNELTLSDVRVYRYSGSDKLTLQYHITNEGAKAAVMPPLHIRLFDKANTLLETYDMEGGEMYLEPNEPLKFKTEFLNIPGSADIVDVTIDNRLDFILR